MIWCLGMYASGSTWLYNAARQTAIACGLPNVTGTYAEKMDALKNLPSDALNVIKTHDLGRAEEKFLDAHAKTILISIRDPRDAVVSLMQHMRHRFLLALEKVENTALFCAQFTADPRAQVFNYDAGFTDQIATFDLLAQNLGGSLNAGTREKLFLNSRRGAIEAYIAALDKLPTTIRDARSGDVVDSDTQWHRHHAGRTGETGRWRAVLPAEAARLVEQRLGGFMRQFGYL
jgi:hypothetical protein